jgi:hydroxymethylpyrimidine pyrophosphatase-like HAD family hydrolase
MKNTVAVGDYYNDIPMIQAARYGVAVANACDAAKEAANYLTVSNEEHAIASIIADIESGKMRF